MQFCGGLETRGNTRDVTDSKTVCRTDCTEYFILVVTGLYSVQAWETFEDARSVGSLNAVNLITMFASSSIVYDSSG